MVCILLEAVVNANSQSNVMSNVTDSGKYKGAALSSTFEKVIDFNFSE